MTVLFGTVEYFKRQLLEKQDSNSLRKLPKEHKRIYSRLQNEILNDFVCAEETREQCMENLACAYDKVTENG